MTLRWKGEDDTAVDMIRALRLYRRTKEQASRVAQAAAIKAMADNLTEWAAKESKAPRPPMPGARGFTQ